MSRWIRKMSLQTAGIFGITSYFLGILIHVGVVVRILPYDWINGGRSVSYAEQVPISILNMIMLLIAIGFTWYTLSEPQKINTIVVWVARCAVLFFVAGFILQLLGTMFEKLFCSIVLLFAILANLRISMSKNS